jgi:hypothetical protein
MPLPLYRRAGSLSNAMPARPLVAVRTDGKGRPVSTNRRFMAF